MGQDLTDFWNRFQSGIDVAVAGNLPDKLLGVRDGFLRYFRERTTRFGPIHVVPHPQDEAHVPLPLEDLEILELARRRAHDLRSAEPEGHAFYVGSETGLLPVRLEDSGKPGTEPDSQGEIRHIVRTWTVVLGLGDEAWGSSGSIQLPERLITGLDHEQLPFSVPGTRRSGGMMSSLTGGLETRRSATALATFLSLSTLTYGLHESRTVRRPRLGRV